MKPYIATSQPRLDNAACKQHDPNIWFDPEHQAQAVAICGTCPAVDACLQYAVTLPIDTEGIYAGQTQQQLVRPRRNNNNPTPIKHGTIAGYSQHHRLGIPACDLCRQAHADYTRERKAKKRAAPVKLKEANITHGTNSGAIQHNQYGIPICEPCRLARNQYMREWNQRKRAKLKTQDR